VIDVFKLLKTITGLIGKRNRNITNNGKKKIMSGFLPEEEKNTHFFILRKKKSLNPRNLPSLPNPRKLPGSESLSPNPSRNLNRFSIPLQTIPRFLSRTKKLLLLSLGIR